MIDASWNLPPLVVATIEDIQVGRGAAVSTFGDYVMLYYTQLIGNTFVNNDNNQTDYCHTK